jgi:hypothetical protein
VTRVPAVRTNTPIGPVTSGAGAASTVPSSGISVGQASAEKSGHQAYVSREWGFQRMQRRRVYSIVRIQVVSAVRLEERLSERSSERPKPSRVHVLQSFASLGSHPQHHCQPHIACWTRRCALRLVTPARDCDARVMSPSSFPIVKQRPVPNLRRRDSCATRTNQSRAQTSRADTVWVVLAVSERDLRWLGSLRVPVRLAPSGLGA